MIGNNVTDKFILSCAPYVDSFLWFIFSF